MPSKLKPGTPSMFAGSRMPCQWMDVSWPWIEPAGSALDTRRLTVVPSRQRNSGAGIEPLTVIAGRVTPVKLAGVSPMVRSNSVPDSTRSEEHTSELQSLMRISYAVFCLKKKTPKTDTQNVHINEETPNKQKTLTENK